MSDSEYSDSDCDTISEIGDDELACKNMDPALAKIMGIIVEETKTDWTPPSHSGLNNSEKIIKDKECELEKIIKKIEKFETLDLKELEFMKTTTNENKLKLIQSYNNIIQTIINP